VKALTVTEIVNNQNLQVVRVIGPMGYTLSNTLAWRATYVTTEALRVGTMYRVEARGRTWATNNKTGSSVNWNRTYTFTTLGNPF